MRFVRWQTPFTYMSAAIPALLAIVFVSDLLVGHQHMNRFMVALWLIFYGVAAALPLILGRRYPLWAGVVMFAVIETWSTYFLLFSSHAHAEINALLELPFVALYLGWFYPPAFGRVLMVIGVIRMLVILMVNPDLGKGLADPNVMVGYAILIAIFCYVGARTVQRQLHREARTDSLTGALNRRGLNELATVVRKRAERAGEPVTVAMIDFDDFKGLNDAGGHIAGDAALIESVEVWTVLVGMRGTSGRSGGLVARLGGDEFALVLRSGPGELEQALDSMRAASQFAWSWGIAESVPGEPLDTALARADDELLRAKPARGKGSITSR